MNLHLSHILPPRFARSVLFRFLHSVRTADLRISDADGQHRFISPGVNKPIIEVNVKDLAVYARVVNGGSREIGATYAEGLWETQQLAEFLAVLAAVSHPYRSGSDAVVRSIAPVIDALTVRRAPSLHHDAANIAAHYDMGNTIFEEILDETMTYSGGVFIEQDSPLHHASVEKLDRILRLTKTSPGDHLLEIGTGWGSFAVHAASQGYRVTTTTLSAAQYEYASQRIQKLGLHDRVEVLHRDYREVHGEYDAVVAIEMIEAVDWRLYETFFAHVRSVLRDGGTLAMQAIVLQHDRFDRAKYTKDFIKSAIFPGGCLPSISALEKAAQRAHMGALVELHDITPHYARTLREWRHNLHANAETLREKGFVAHRQRLWDFYFAYCQAGFSSRDVQLVQIAFR